MPVQWNENYATGYPEIDSQHQRLFDMLNDFERRFRRVSRRPR